MVCVNMNLYCKIFVNTDSDYSQFFNSLFSFLNGKKLAVSFIVSDWCSISISRNKEYTENSTDFLYWKYFIDVDSETSDEVLYIKRIRELVNFLKQNYSGAVCACDFEELL